MTINWVVIFKTVRQAGDVIIYPVYFAIKLVLFGTIYVAVVYLSTETEGTNYYGKHSIIR